LRVEFPGTGTIAFLTFNVPVTNASTGNNDVLITIDGEIAGILFAEGIPLTHGLALGASQPTNPWRATAGTDEVLTGPGGSQQLEASSGNTREPSPGAGQFTISEVYWLTNTSVAIRFSNGVTAESGDSPNLILINGESITLTTTEASDILLASLSGVAVGDAWSVAPGASNTLVDSTSSPTMTAATGVVM
jgi:hypothetical protein